MENRVKQTWKLQLKYFTREEYLLWGTSMLFIIGAFWIFDRENLMTLFASILGSTAIMISAKGNPLGQVMMIVFSILYAIISYSCAYYGEMFTYLGMTAPMALFSLIAWLKNPYKGNRAEVEVYTIQKNDVKRMLVLSILVTIVFYCILEVCNTANIIPGTISVTTSFIAAYLTYKRSPFFSLAYAANDIVLLVLWTLATMEERSYFSVVVCFAAFLANDIYGYINWNRMKQRQEEGSQSVIV